MIKEITAQELNSEEFINEKVNEIQRVVGNGRAINALSGGVDSSTVTMLGHRALGHRLRQFTLKTAHARGRVGTSRRTFPKARCVVEIVEARKEFFAALKGITNPEEKREAITQTFYRNVFGRLVKESGAKHLLQGTILTTLTKPLQESSGSTMSSSTRNRPAGDFWLPHS